VKIEGLAHDEAERKKANMQTVVRFTNMLLPGLLIIVYGLLRYKAEINRRKRIKEIYE